jgi:predicted NUDIX family NTP pyrophosphohydrolase
VPPAPSAGLLLYRFVGSGDLEVFLVHPGGPFWARKDDWSVPKGEFDPATEDPYAAAVREFTEETALPIPSIEPLHLGEAKQRSGKVVHVWALEGWVDPAELVSNEFDLEWPRGSGVIRSFPEVDRGAWFPLADARAKIMAGQAVFLDRLVDALAGSSPEV